MGYRVLGAINTYLLKLKNGDVFQSLYLSRKGNQKFLGVNLETFNQEELPYDYLKNAIVYGIPAGGGMRGDFLNLWAEGQSGFVASQAGIKIPVDISVPKIGGFKHEERVALFVNNDSILALASINQRDKNGVGSTPFWVFDKETDKWHKVVVRGGVTAIRGFGSWVAGAEVGARKFSDQEKIEMKKKEKGRKTGGSASLRFAENDYISYGGLFIYDVKSKKKYRITTNESDCEVLLVDQGFVYFRINDELYKSQIGENKILNQELILKDEFIADVHWMFK